MSILGGAVATKTPSSSFVWKLKRKRAVESTVMLVRLLVIWLAGRPKSCLWRHSPYVLLLALKIMPLVKEF